MIRLDAETTVADATRLIAHHFTAALLPSPIVDARFLMQGILGLEAVDVLMHGGKPIGPHGAELLMRAVKRRLSNEPVSRILGWREFYGRRFEITPDVLDPRADSESIITLALAIVAEKGWRESQCRIADIGTGSGILACTLLAELPLASALATDVSEAAIAVASRNAAQIGIADRLTLVATRGLTGIVDTFDMIVSNPPYIPSADVGRLEKDVRDFDPHLALDGGTDGLDVYREIICDIIALAFCGTLILEFGQGQGDAVAALFEPYSSAPMQFATDLGGHRRAVAVEIHC